MKHERVVVYVTDAGYLAQSVLSAKQLAARGVHQLADILVFTIDIEPRVLSVLNSQLNGTVEFRPLESREFQLPPGVEFSPGHVPFSTLGRLVIEPELPKQYEHIVYLDGDTQVVGDVTPLVSHTVPDGLLAAVRGSAWLDPTGTSGLEPEGYLESLGVEREGYFNAGVLAVQRATWAVNAPRALEYFFEHSPVRHDQSALNAVFAGRIQYLRIEYNFNWYYAASGIGKVLPARILHFTGPMKPWRAWGQPWGIRPYIAYSRLLSEHPILRPFLKLRGTRVAIRSARKWQRDLRNHREIRSSATGHRRMLEQYSSSADFPF